MCLLLFLLIQLGCLWLLPLQVSVRLFLFYFWLMFLALPFSQCIRKKDIKPKLFLWHEHTAVVGRLHSQM